MGALITKKEIFHKAKFHSLVSLERSAPSAYPIKMMVLSNHLRLQFQVAKRKT